jgi:hypothetical protein
VLTYLETVSPDFEQDREHFVKLADAYGVSISEEDG